MDSNTTPTPGQEFQSNPLFAIIFDMVYNDLQMIFTQEESLQAVLSTFALPPITRLSVMIIRESHLRGKSIMEAALDIGMHPDDWTDWTIMYASDFFVQFNNSVIKL